MREPVTLPDGIQRRGLSREEAAAYCGLSVNSLDKHGPKPACIGRRRVWDRRVLDLWFDQLNGLICPAHGANPLLEAIHRRRDAAAGGTSRKEPRRAIRKTG